MAESIDTEMSEAERRDLVRQLAGRKARSEELAETTAAPSYDYSQAAMAATAADPVELPPEAMAELGDTVGAPAADAKRYADAQAAIFQRGQDREGAYGNAYYDRMGQMAGAINHQLTQYDADLAEAEAARAAASSYGGGYGGSSSGGVGYGQFDSEVTNPLEGGGSFLDMEPWEERVNADYVPNLEAINPDRDFLEANADSYAAAESLLQEVYIRGGTLGGATGQAFSMLVRDFGMSDADARRLIATLENVWAPQFAQHDGGGSEQAPAYGSLAPPAEEPDRGYLPWDQDPRNPNYVPPVKQTLTGPR
jgi:hypothetical protein